MLALKTHKKKKQILIQIFNKIRKFEIKQKNIYKT